MEQYTSVLPSDATGEADFRSISAKAIPNHEDECGDSDLLKNPNEGIVRASFVMRRGCAVRFHPASHQA